jgi:Tfp pilus assembly protein PilP
MDRKKIIMVVLVIIFLISLVYRIMHPFRQESVTELTYVGDRVVVKAIKGDSSLSEQNASEEGAKVRIDLFLSPPRHKGKVIRNVFEATTVQKTTQPAGTAKKEPQQKAALEIPKKENPLASAKQDLSRFNVFGMFERGDEKIVFLERGKEVLVVRKGDRIDGKYMVESITDQKIMLTAKQLSEPVYIMVGEL